MDCSGGCFTIKMFGKPLLASSHTSFLPNALSKSILVMLILAPKSTNPHIETPSSYATPTHHGPLHPDRSPASPALGSNASRD
eukprot:maker-scaffold321_size207582-snap-gene-0.12 protein:Tk05186 transcript:maker-scaffold321_size207582-snap-gene-0.12-mRNA-1 annotation:"---NA---"